jgi:hypothetical protein
MRSIHAVTCLSLTLELTTNRGHGAKRDPSDRGTRVPERGTMRSTSPKAPSGLVRWVVRLLVVCGVARGAGAGYRLAWFLRIKAG